MGGGELLAEITGYCRAWGLAESTFGRLAVNDGKFVARLRDGGRVTDDTARRVRTFISQDRPPSPLAPSFGPPDRMRTAGGPG